RRNLAGVASLFDQLWEANALAHKPVREVKRPKAKRMKAKRLRWARRRWPGTGCLRAYCFRWICVNLSANHGVDRLSQVLVSLIRFNRRLRNASNDNSHKPSLIICQKEPGAHTIDHCEDRRH